MLVIGAAPLVPPPLSESGPASFSAERAFEHIERLAVEPHPIGTEAIVRVRSKIVTELEALGLTAELQSVEVPAYYGPPGGRVSVVNVMARIRGTASTGAVVMMGHYDSVPWGPGANDDASAVAIMLESARAILARDRLRNDVILLFTDGEEPAPRFGSTAFVQEHPWMRDVAFVVNLEAIGGNGPSTLIALNGPQAWVIDGFVEAVPDPAAYSYLSTTGELIGASSTDFAPFRERGIPGVELAYLHGSSIYHLPADNPDSVSLETLQQHGVNALAIARQFANLDLGAARDQGETVFFTVGTWVVRVSADWVLPLFVLSGALILAGIWRRRAWIPTLLGLGSILIAIAGTALVAGLVWTVLAGWRTSMSLAESYAYLVVLVALSVVIVAAAARLGRRRVDLGARVAGVVAAWWGLGLLVTILSPGLGYLFAWPALAGGIALLASSPDASHPWWQALWLVLVVGPTLVIIAPAIDTFYQLAQPRPGNLDSQILPVIIIPAMLLVMVVALIAAFRVRPSSRTSAAQ
jgi:hypothetical protein